MVSGDLGGQKAFAQIAIPDENLEIFQSLGPLGQDLSDILGDTLMNLDRTNGCGGFGSQLRWAKSPIANR